MFDRRLLFEMAGLPVHEARRLLAVATGQSPAGAGRLEEVGEEAVSRFLQLAEARRAGEPLQYLEGEAVFGPVTVLVDQRVLIPRPETEQLWELASGLVTEPSLVVDLCTGSGALALALKDRFPGATIVGTDLSRSALEVARLNSERLGLEVDWRWGDLFEALPVSIRGRVNLIVANPPYVAEGEWDSLPTDVRYEPREALVAGPKGTEVVERVIAGAPAWLRPQGVLVTEIGENQGGEVLAMLELAGLAGRIEKDLQGRGRFAAGTRLS